MKKFLLLATAAAAVLSATSASAAIYVFSGAGTGITFSGTFTTSDTANGSGGYAITNTVGSATVGANNISFTGPTTYAGADNNLFPNAAQFFSFDGTSFLLANGNSANLYYSAGSTAYRIITSNGQSITLTSFTLSPAAAAVPETATWGMMIAGFGMIGGAARYRRRSAKLAFAAA